MNQVGPRDRFAHKLCLSSNRSIAIAHIAAQGDTLQDRSMRSMLGQSEERPIISRIGNSLVLKTVSKIQC